MLVFTIQSENGVVCYHKIEPINKHVWFSLTCQVWVIYWEIQRKYLIGSHLGTESTEIPRGKAWK